MRAHFEEKSSTELYQSLVNLRQLPDEDPQSFLIRALNKGQICILINAKDEIRSLIAQPLFNLFLDPRDRSEGRQSSCQIKAPVHWALPVCSSVSVARRRSAVILNQSIKERQICVFINAKDEIRLLISQPLLSFLLDPRDGSEGRQSSCQIKSPVTKFISQ